jgi:hypothetical protein
VFSEYFFSLDSHFSELFCKRRNSGLDDIPENCVIQPKIFMGDHVPQAGYLPPGDLRMFLSETAGHLPGCFPDHLQTADNCQKRASVFFQFFCIMQPVREFENILAGL